MHSPDRAIPKRHVERLFRYLASDIQEDAVECMKAFLGFSKGANTKPSIELTALRERLLGRAKLFTTFRTRFMQRLMPLKVCSCR
jgi:hypothetical protein